MKEQKQHKYDVAYLRIATEWSKLSYCKRKQVGAIIVRDRMIISDGYNGTPSGFENCCEDDEGLTKWYVLHAEANAISKVARSTQTCENATLYITLSPCKECSRCFLVERVDSGLIGHKWNCAKLPRSRDHILFAYFGSLQDLLERSISDFYLRSCHRTHQVKFSNEKIEFSIFDLKLIFANLNGIKIQ